MAQTEICGLGVSPSLNISLKEEKAELHVTVKIVTNACKCLICVGCRALYILSIVKSCKSLKWTE